jgi:hypothetical protein
MPLELPIPFLGLGLGGVCSPSRIAQLLGRRHWLPGHRGRDPSPCNRHMLQYRNFALRKGNIRRCRLATYSPFRR